MVRKLYEIVKLENIILYRGTQHKTDPISTNNFYNEYLSDNNKFRWFTEEPHVAELYGSNSVWVYFLKGPIYLLKIYDEQSSEITTTSLKVLDFIINNYIEKFIKFSEKRKEDNLKDFCDMLPDKNNITTYLKIPFGLLTTEEQYLITKPDNMEPPTNIINIDNNNNYFIQKNIFQRLSLYNLDKFLTIFLDKYKTELLYYYLLFKNFPHDSPLVNELRQKQINGYTATKWNTMWHGSFHGEICLFDTPYDNALNDKTSLIFIGRYKVKNDEREWITYDNKKIHYQIPFKEINTRLPEIRQLCLLGNTNSYEYMNTTGGSSIKTSSNKSRSNKNIFGKLESVPDEQYNKPLSVNEKQRILRSMFKYVKYNEKLKSLSSSYYSSYNSSRKKNKKNSYDIINNPSFLSY